MIDGDLVVAEARKWLGTPYRHQASKLGAGADCLGLVRGVWRGLIGIEPEQVPPYTFDWSEPSGTEDLLNAAQRWLTKTSEPAIHSGDILVFRMRSGYVAKHLGIAASVGANPTFIHSYTGHGVIETSLSAPWARRIAGCFQFPKGTE